MLSDYIPLCAPDAWYYGTTSLNQPADIAHAKNGYLEIIQTIPDVRDNAEARAIIKSSNKYIWQFILDLPLRLRLVAYAYYWLDWSQKRIADYFDVSPSAINQSLQKIHKAGREKLTLN